MLDARSYSNLEPIDPVKTRRRALSLSSVIVGLLLLLTMVGAGYFRFVGQNWDDYVHLHPDERFLGGVASSLGRPLSPLLFTNSDPSLNQIEYDDCMARNPQTAGVGGYFDTACSSLNPYNLGYGTYVYGTLPLYLTRWSAEFAVEGTRWLADQGVGSRDQMMQLASVWVSYDGIHLVWRFLSAIADMIAVIFVFGIGQQLYGKWAGLAAAMLYGFAVFPIQQAHFGTADAMTNCFFVVALWFAVRVQLKGQWADYALFGLACGAALAGRINIAPLAGLVILAAILRGLPAFSRHTLPGERRSLLVGSIVGLVIAGAVTIICFRVFQPNAFMGPGFFGLSINPHWLSDLQQSQYTVSGASEIPPNWQWVGRTPYLFPFFNIVLWGAGIGLGIAGWLAWVWAGYRLIRGKLGSTANLLLFVWVLVYFGWLGRQWVMTMRYYLPLYPVLALLAAWGLSEIIRRSRGLRIRHALSWAVTFVVIGFTLLWAVMFTNIYRHQMTAVQAGEYVWEHIPGDFSMRVDGTPDSTPLMNIALINNFGAEDNNPLAQATRFENGQSYNFNFTATASGMVTSVHAPHLADPNDDPDPESLRIEIVAGDDDPSREGAALATGTLTTSFVRDTNVMGRAYDIPLDRPLAVEKGKTYTFHVEAVSGGPFTSSGATMAWEGDWDEVFPSKTCTLPDGLTLEDDPPPGLNSALTCNGRDPWSTLINGYKLQLIYEDVPEKRDIMQTALDNSDYLIIGTNRRYDSNSRIPGRWPMTMKYYDALFSGQLGYKEVAQFQETFQIGPLQISDQYLPTYSGPKWLNEFEAEEAFHVYDHPVVMLYQKTDAYSSGNTRSILDSVPLNSFGPVALNCPEAADYPTVNYYCDPTLVAVAPLQADGLNLSQSGAQAPTELQIPIDERAAQASGGTWSNRFDPASALNANPALLVVVWWLTIVLFGWLTWPLLFAVFPGLADRGFGFAKIIGLFLTGWLSWYVASARIPVWSQAGLAGAFLIVAAFSLLVAWRSRSRIGSYIADHWGRLALIELITLLCFVFFLAVRLSNPDLWHPSFGGEKPMDFAYFNGVLRSTVFPPVDPWYTGGYINYYYFGFIIVGTPTLLLGVVPTVAYNLILPTLFALTGIGAFSVAYNVVSALRARSNLSDDDERPRRKLGNPWLAGIAALLLAVLLGNLDTPRQFIVGLAETGGYAMPTGLEDWLTQQYRDQYNGTDPSGQAQVDIQLRAQANALSDRIPYELHNLKMGADSIIHGAQLVLSGQQPLSISPDRWFWGPTRVLAEAPVDSGGAIAELPYFTFLYGDLHAHMISMPLQFFAMAFIFNELIMAGRERRNRLLQWLALALGAAVVGLMRATNTWDWPTFTALSVAGLAYAWYLRYRGLSRESLVNFVMRVGGFIALGFLAALPFITWFAAAYNRVLPWTGNRTPIWAYLDVHGLFLFLVLSLLVWDTVRWFRSVHVRSLRGTWVILISTLLAALIALIGVIILTLTGYQASLIGFPLLVWIVALFFRAHQTRPVQFVLVLAGLALALTLAVEFIVLDGDIGRQNTVFKFYMQAWLLFSVAGGCAFAWVLQSAARWRAVQRTIWYTAAFILIFIAAMFPFMATPGKAVFRMAPGMPVTLDGMAYMQYASQYEGSQLIIQNDPTKSPFSLNGDYNLIHWLEENVQGTPTIMEGRSEREYLWGSRISIYTGLPSVVGWRFHQTQQRTLNPLTRLVDQRLANVNAFYMTQDIGTAWGILRFYDVSYVIVGALERAYYPQSSLDKLDQMVQAGLLEVAYTDPASGSMIYRVIKTAQWNGATDSGRLAG